LSQYEVHWPSYNFALYKFDATSGAYLGNLTSTADPGVAPIVFRIYNQDRDGTLWSCEAGSSQHAHRCSITITSDNENPLIEGPTEYDFSTFAGVSFINAFAVELGKGLLLAGINNQSFLRVFSLSDGSLVRAIATPGIVTQVMPEDANRCYIMTAPGILCLIN